MPAKSAKLDSGRAHMATQTTNHNILASSPILSLEISPYGPYINPNHLLPNKPTSPIPLFIAKSSTQHSQKTMASTACASSAIAAVAFSSPSSQKSGCIVGSTKASFLGGKKLRVSKIGAPSGARSVGTVCVAADPDRPLWFPGSTPPEWLDGSLPGDFGFDPLGLGSDPDTLKWNQQAELVHCRWAMLGAAGIFIPEFLTKIGILNTPSWYTAGEQEYFTDKTTLFIVELIFIGWAEGRRWADIINPGCVNTDPIFPNNKLTGTDVGYPGGLWFDPLGWGSGSPQKLKELRTKEIKNGRLAMLAVMGAWFQAIYTGTGPIDNLFAHLADPGHATIFAAFKG